MEGGEGGGTVGGSRGGALAYRIASIHQRESREEGEAKKDEAAPISACRKAPRETLPLPLPSLLFPLPCQSLASLTQRRRRRVPTRTSK